MFQKLKVLFFVCLFSFNLPQKLSLEEKIAQLLIAHFNGEVANEDAKVLVQDIKVGGIIYYNWANGLNSPEQVRNLSAGLQKLAEKNIPLLIVTDQEGGVVNRLSNGFTIFPGNKALGMTKDPSLAEEAARAMGEEMLRVGVNMNLAPVVDVNITPRNPVIGVRAFSDQPETVAAFGEKALKGYNQAGIITTLKHYPGHGDVTTDSHEDLPILNKSMEELEKCELLPFKKLAPSADAIVTAHILVPAFDKEKSSTFSEKILSYLRNTIGFKGAIISDSLVMEGVLKSYKTVDEAAIAALKAGCDILLLGGKQLIGGNLNFELTTADIQRIHQSLVKAVKNGTISEERINEALERVLKLKQKSLTFKNTKPNSEDHGLLAYKIASRALEFGQKGHIPSLNQGKIAIFAPEILRNNISSLLNIGNSTDAYFFNGLNPTSAEMENAKKFAETKDTLIVCSYNAWKNPSQQTLIQSLISTKKPCILLVTRDPLDADLFPDAKLIIKTFSPTQVSIQAVCDRLIEMSK